MFASLAVGAASSVVNWWLSAGNGREELSLGPPAGRALADASFVGDGAVSCSRILIGGDRSSWNFVEPELVELARR